MTYLKTKNFIVKPACIKINWSGIMSQEPIDKYHYYLLIRGNFEKDGFGFGNFKTEEEAQIVLNKIYEAIKNEVNVLDLEKI